MRIDESISNTENGQADITDTKNEASEDYVDMPQWYMEQLAAHVKAIRKLRFEAKTVGTWKGGDRNFVFHAGTGKPHYHTSMSSIQNLVPNPSPTEKKTLNPCDSGYSIKY
ncbi:MULTISPECIES: hypothetical protein [unclassified Paenibacillus]|uniref:hypothetical protein n=1 Tax=unclassified Paenibacillus TaxID=185978 RepID=UPI000419A5CD|nr:MULTISPECIES: hypothetical protein [unclassified Paenibacillus]KGP81839.1 hypothetical protein P364_0115935 [Paenibacillus sp. MAEPY2]KGP86618.1 hypothetical protein P363_0116225 [Paenibacillus sp. MAEPY1]